VGRLRSGLAGRIPRKALERARKEVSAHRGGLLALAAKAEAGLALHDVLGAADGGRRGGAGVRAAEAREVLLAHEAGSALGGVDRVDAVAGDVHGREHVLGALAPREDAAAVLDVLAEDEAEENVDATEREEEPRGDESKVIDVVREDGRAEAVKNGQSHV
jgi:hypothetical protein